MTLWRFGKEDSAPALLIVLLPLVLALPQLLDWLKADPMLYAGAMTNGFVRGFLRGFPHIDPNSGYTTQALGYRAALDWLQGNVPWWNFYSGVGLPLAGEYQPAAFFPLTLLLLLPQGMAWQMLALQLLSGLGTYGLLRQMGVGRLAATTGGVLYAFNGTLAWFSHGPATAVPFLPLLLWGIERAFAKTTLRRRGGWRLVALAMGLSLLAGFPETAYIDGLLALAWALVRGVQTARDLRLGYALRIVSGGAVGICLAAPQLLAFVEFLPEAYLGGHGAGFAHSALPKDAVIPSLIAPYAYGPIFAYQEYWPSLMHVWGGIGGYVTVLLLAMATYGVVAHRGALGWLLLGWSVLAIAKTFHIEPAVTLLNLVPGVSLAAFARYAQPSWELAFVIMAAWGLDDLAQTRAPRRAGLAAAGFVLIVALAGALLYGADIWPHLRSSVGLRNSAFASALWAILTGAACFWLITRARASRAAVSLAILLMVDGVLMFAIPTLSNPRGGAVNLRAIGFLRDHLGLQRFFTLGPIQPNYGAYFGIASINHNYLPVSARWIAWVGTHLDRSADAAVFNGDYARAAGMPTPTEELRRNLAAYEWVGVKYVIAPRDVDPFAGMDDAASKGKSVRRVFADGSMGIYELPGAKPYFEALAGRCIVEPQGRGRVFASCEERETLLRRELFFPGWTATVNGENAPIVEHGALFQAVDLPKGKSEVRYDYAPPHIAWAWLAALAAMCALVFPAIRRSPQS